jgi:rod shape-determining protein MreB
MDQAILHYIRLKHGLLLGERTAEDIKIKIGSAYDKRAKSRSKPLRVTTKEEDKAKEEENKEKLIIVRGRDIETGLPKSLKITESEVREALTPIFSQITQAVADVLEETPPELLPDILEQGILLTGGGAKIPGLDHLLVERIHMPVVVAHDSLTSVVRGTGKVLEVPALLERVKVIGGLK